MLIINPLIVKVLFNKKNMINVSHNNIKTFNIIKPIQIINNKNKNTIKYNIIK